MGPLLNHWKISPGTKGGGMDSVDSPPRTCTPPFGGNVEQKNGVAKSHWLFTGPTTLYGMYGGGGTIASW